jgi:hypothetical protein
MSGLDGLGWPNPEDEPKPSRKTMRIHKSKTSKQYTSGPETTRLCVCTGKWMIENGVSKQYGVMLFYGGAYDNISRTFAADILRQFRKDQKLIAQNQ